MTDDDFSGLHVALVLFHDWLREKLIMRDGVDPLGESDAAVHEFLGDTMQSVVAAIDDIFKSFGDIFGGDDA